MMKWNSKSWQFLELFEEDASLSLRFLLGEEVQNWDPLTDQTVR
jgi:hypothetical protein